MGRKGERPAIPLNLVGDLGGGGLLLAFGVVSALFETQKSGKGQVVDAAMVDGVAALMASIYDAMQLGYWSDKRGENLVDSGVAFYDVYETSDGKHVSIGSLEPQFYKELIEKLGIEDRAPAVGEHLNRDNWDALRPTLTEVFLQKTRDEWCEVFNGSDACFTPVLAAAEAFKHEHHLARRSFIDVEGVKQAAPAPRFSRTKPADPRAASERGADTEEILRECGVKTRP
jgi:alpha-methylacyl-CoA racemase